MDNPFDLFSFKTMLMIVRILIVYALNINKMVAGLLFSKTNLTKTIIIQIEIIKQYTLTLFQSLNCILLASGKQIMHSS